MKKMMLGLAAMALIFASCSKDEVTGVNGGKNSNAIGFEMSTGKTRATKLSLASLQTEGNTFNVYATQGATPAQFINDAAYKYTGGAWKWAVSNIMWPEEASTDNTKWPINFYAYYPTTHAGIGTKTFNPTTQTIQYTIQAENAQMDYLAAHPAQVAMRPASSNVDMAFQHILSKIDFRIATDPEVYALVQSIRIVNVANSNTFNFASMAWTPSSPASGYNNSYSYLTAPAVAANKVSNPDGNLVVNTTGSLMLMPQDLSTKSWNPTPGTDGVPTVALNTSTMTYLEVVYRVFAKADDEDITGYTDASDHPNYAGSAAQTASYTGGLYVKVAYALPTNLEMKKGYTYKIILGSNDATGGYLVDPNFKKEDGTDSGLPVVVPGTNPVEPIVVPQPIVNVNKPIGYTVTVTAWSENFPADQIEVK